MESVVKNLKNKFYSEYPKYKILICIGILACETLNLEDLKERFILLGKNSETLRGKHISTELLKLDPLNIDNLHTILNTLND